MSPVKSCGNGVARAGSALPWGNTVRQLQSVVLLLRVAKTITPLSEPSHPKRGLRIPPSSLSPFPRDDLVRMGKVVVAGRGQQGDTVTGKKGETFSGVLLTCSWSMSSSLSHQMRQEPEGERA